MCNYSMLLKESFASSNSSASTAINTNTPVRGSRSNDPSKSRVQSMGAGKGGDGGAAEEAAAAAAAEPVVLKTELHCAGCAEKVKKAIKRVPGVVSIMADAAANRVVVRGTADAAALKARLEAKTKKAVEIISAGSGPKKPAPAAAEPKGAGAGEKKDGGAGEGKADKDASPKEEKEKEKKQPPEEKKPTEETVLLKIRLHCDGCADRIRRRIYKIKGVKDVVLDGNAKDEVKVRGTMDISAMLSYLKEKLNRDVEAVAPAKKDGGEAKDDNKDKSGDGNKKNKAAAAAAAQGGDDTKSKGKGIEVAAAVGSWSTAAAAAFMAAPAGPSTYHVAPPQGYVAYQQGPPPPASYYPPPYPYYGNADGMGHANPSAAATYYPNPGYQHQPDGSQQHQGYPPYPYRFDTAPAPQFFSDENPNACSVM